MAVAFASQTLTAAGVFTDTQTVTIGGKVYTTQTALTNVDGNVLIGANAAATLANLKAAVNLSAGAGTLYATAMTANPDVLASTVTATTLLFIAKVPGTVGNTIAATETQTNASFAAATLAGGSGNISTDIRALVASSSPNAGLAQALIDLTDPEGVA